MRSLLAIVVGWSMIFPGLVLGVEEDVKKQEESPFVYDDHGNRDPFWRLVDPKGMIRHYDDDLMVSDLKLEGIIFDEKGRSLAIINGRVVKVHDQLGQFVIDRIDDDMVVLMNGQKRFELVLKSVKK